MCDALEMLDNENVRTKNNNGKSFFILNEF